VLGGGGGRWSSEVAEAPPWPRVADGVGRGGGGDTDTGGRRRIGVTRDRATLFLSCPPLPFFEIVLCMFCIKQ
jgi:hypothetical protein